MCVDALNAQHALTKYEEMYPAFGDSRDIYIDLCNGALTMVLDGYSYSLMMSLRRMTLNANPATTHGQVEVIIE